LELENTPITNHVDLLPSSIPHPPERADAKLRAQRGSTMSGRTMPLRGRRHERRS
jgi:hypothetical protein